MSVLQATKLRTPQLSPKPMVSQTDAVPEECAQLSEATCSWDSLSKITLTLTSLREYDRRVHKETDLPNLYSLTSNAGDPTGQARQRLKRFARRGGPDLSHLIGGLEKLADRVPRLDDTATSAAERFVQMVNLEKKLIRNGLYPPGYKFPNDSHQPKPLNFLDIRTSLASRRLSVGTSQFDEEELQDFRAELEQAGTEATIMHKVIPIVTGNEGKKHRTELDNRFNNLEPLGKDMSVPQPDLYYGADPFTIDQRVQDELDQHIIPCTTGFRPAAPNFFLELKGSDGSAREAQLQALHDAAHGALAMHKLQNYGQVKPTYDNKAYSLATTFHPTGGMLSVFAVHPTPPTIPQGPTSYHMTLVNIYAMSGNEWNFREGLTAYRNARDLAKTYRDEFIKQANKAAALIPGPEPNATTSKRDAQQLDKPSDGVSKDDQNHEEPRPAKRPRASPVPRKTRSEVDRTGGAATTTTVYTSTSSGPAGGLTRFKSSEFSGGNGLAYL
ncbi:hypothetical protein AYO21_04495 [Fonsecaea monophora]|uniref:Uncharacterized protein n=1 Tax=Fonsecaea monophora TaxID=254056 RepID=A0A177FD05_9EURO|nr:hypothetical protein AYO21_04495 [Fonsecaea monophora]OAG41332.1 hypothetical protein AYO21_04495 [Fonsecaea monophora]